MIKELINYLFNVASKHKSINNVSYLRDYNINDQHSRESFQFIIENDTPLLQKQIVMGILTLDLSIDIIGFVGKRSKVIDIQDEALHIALDILEYISNDNEYPLEIHDYSILALTEYTDDNSSGVRLSLSLVIPSPINLCEYQDNFINKDEPTIPTIDIENGDDCTNSKFKEEGSTLTLNPIKLQ